jgi:putative restriction endonuclease
MIKDLVYYIKKFTQLRVDRATGIAPNKPILLLSVIDLISQEQITENKIAFSAELIATFFELWSHLELVRYPDMAMPFYHLQGDNFWHFKMNLGYELLMESKVKIRTPRLIKELVEYAYFDEELWELLLLKEQRSILVDTLLDVWFKERQQELKSLMQVNVFAELEVKIRRDGGKVYTPEELKDEQKAIVRDGAFRKAIVSTYNHSCAFCGLKILNTRHQNIVDGCHIKPFSQFYDDRINNGISFCKNHHWGFDRFWFTIDNNFKIVIANNLLESSPNAKTLADFNEESIVLPAQRKNYPRPDALEWHQQEFYKVNR